MPHFYDAIPPEIRDLTHPQAVERYRAGAARPTAAIAGLTPSQLTAFPVPGTWSIQQIIMHLLDTDLAAAYRMKRIIAENSPQLDVYDENAFVEHLAYHERSVELACETFRLNRLATAETLQRLPDSSFDRAANHPEVGTLRLGQLLRLYVHHLDHHLRFVADKRVMVAGV